MPLVILAIIVLLGLALFVRSRATKACPWKEDTFRNTSANRRWVCSRCQVSVYCEGDAPPKRCHRDQRDV